LTAGSIKGRTGNTTRTSRLGVNSFVRPEPAHHVTRDLLDEGIARGKAVRPLGGAAVEHTALAAGERRHHGVAAQDAIFRDGASSTRALPSVILSFLRVRRAELRSSQAKPSET